MPSKKNECGLHAFACFCCGKVRYKVPKHWTDKCATALCDSCGIDAVLMVPKYWATVPSLRKHLDEFLALMYDECFGVK
jgi:transcription elongation factor Elf1